MVKGFDIMNNTVVILVAGDLLCYPHMTESTNGDLSLCFCKIKDELKNCDFLIGNLETPVAGEELGYTKERYRFNSPESYLKALKECGFDLLTLANNHCMDRDEIGMVNTLNNCKRYGIDTIGVYKSPDDTEKVYVRNINGIKVSFVNYTYGTNAFSHKVYMKNPWHVKLTQPEELLEGSIHLLQPPEKIADDVQRIYRDKSNEYEIVLPYLENMKKDIEKAKAESDFVVMLLHSGGQYNEFPEEYTKMLTEKIRDYGADIILANHPHIIQSTEYSDGFITVYSYGNFIFSPSSSDVHEIDSTYSALIGLCLDKNADGKVSVKMKFSICKVIDDNGIPKVVNGYDFANENPDYKEEVIAFANRFAGEKRYDTLEKEYYL